MFYEKYYDGCRLSLNKDNSPNSKHSFVNKMIKHVDECSSFFAAICYTWCQNKI